MLCNKIDLAFVLGLLAFVHGMPADSQSNERVSTFYFRKYYHAYICFHSLGDRENGNFFPSFHDDKSRNLDNSSVTKSEPR